MNCPLCVEKILDETFHQGIEIDVCPRCRGIWLDRGELDRLMGTTDAPAAVSRRRPADRDDAGGPDRSKSSKKNKKRRLMDKLGDALEEVLDL